MVLKMLKARPLSMPRPQAGALPRGKQQGGQALPLILAVLLLAILLLLPVINRTSYGLGGSSIHPILPPPQGSAGPAAALENPAPERAGFLQALRTVYYLTLASLPVNLITWGRHTAATR